MKEAGGKDFILSEIAGVRARRREKEPPQVSECQTPVQIQAQSPNRFLCVRAGSLAILSCSTLCRNCDSRWASQVKMHSEKAHEAKSPWRVDIHAKEFCVT